MMPIPNAGLLHRFTQGLASQSDGIFETSCSEIAVMPSFRMGTEADTTTPSLTTTKVEMCVCGARCSLFSNVFSVSV
jgi:hypothetical protein